MVPIPMAYISCSVMVSVEHKENQKIKMITLDTPTQNISCVFSSPLPRSTIDSNIYNSDSIMCSFAMKNKVKK